MDKQKKNLEWYLNLKGMISFNGAIWGSSYAESMIYDENAPTKDLKNIISNTAKLEPRSTIETSLKIEINDNDHQIWRSRSRGCFKNNES